MAGKRALHYLQATKSLKLVYPPGSDFNITVESDSGWSGHDDRRLTSDYFVKPGFNGEALSWQTKKQQTVALSSWEVEYQGLADAVQEATFLRSLLCERGYQQIQATTIGEDIHSCMKLATDPVMHKQAKHIDTKSHFVGGKVDDYSVQLVYTPADQLAVGLLTKTLPQVKVEQNGQKLLRQMQILPPTNGKI